MKVPIQEKRDPFGIYRAQPDLTRNGAVNPEGRPHHAVVIGSSLFTKGTLPKPQGQVLMYSEII